MIEYLEGMEFCKSSGDWPYWNVDIEW